MLHADEMATIWVVRGGPRDRLVKPFLDDGEIGVVFPRFPDGHDVDRAKALRILGVGIDDEPTKQQEHDTAQFLSFVRRIRVGDIAMLVDPMAGGFACGVVTGEYRHRDDLDPDRAQHRRPVEWRRRLPFTALPARLDHLPDQRSVLDDVPDGRLRDLALQCTELRLGDDPFDRPPVPPARRASSGGSAPRRPRTPRAPAPKRPSQVARAERRCTVCLVTKSDDLFEDGDVCRDCA